MMISTEVNLTGRISNAVIHEYPELEDLNVTPSMEEQHFKSEKYGYDNVTIGAIESEELNITPTEEEQIKEGLFDKVTVVAIQTEEKSVELDFINSDINEITPTEGSYLKKVTINKDENLIAENIAKDVVINGVVGELEGGGEYNAVIDTSLVPTNTTGSNINYTLNKMIVKLPEIDTSQWTSTAYLFYNCLNLKEIPLINTSNVTIMTHMFDSCSSLQTIPQLDMSNVKTVTGMFYNCSSLQTIPELDTSNVTNMMNMFDSCSNLQTIPHLDSGNVTNINHLFYNCSSLQTIPELNTSNVTQMSYTFYNCSSLQTIPELDTSNVTNISYLFNNCNLITSLPLFDASKVNKITNMLGCKNITNFGGLKNLGKNYTVKKTNNINDYQFSIGGCTKLTHESLMNIINNLYDLNLSYDVANGGTLYTQNLYLGSTNKAKLTPEEIAVATNKGWTVS